MGPLKFGVVICHEGWRYPESLRRHALGKGDVGVAVLISDLDAPEIARMPLSE